MQNIMSQTYSSVCGVMMLPEASWPPESCCHGGGSRGRTRAGAAHWPGRRCRPPSPRSAQPGGTRRNPRSPEIMGTVLYLTKLSKKFPFRPKFSLFYDLLNAYSHTRFERICTPIYGHTWNSWSWVRCTMLASLVMSPPESLMPMMFLWLASLTTLASGRSRLVLAGTL